MAIKKTYTNKNFNATLSEIMHTIDILKRIEMNKTPSVKGVYEKTEIKISLKDTISFLEEQILLRNYVLFPEASDADANRILSSIKTIPDFCIFRFCKYDFLYFARIDIDSKSIIRFYLEEDLKMTEYDLKMTEAVCTTNEYNAELDSYLIEKKILSITKKYLEEIKSIEQNEYNYHKLSTDFICNLPLSPNFIAECVMKRFGLD